MYEVKHYGFSNGKWTTLRANVREYATLTDAYAFARYWVDSEGGQAQVYEGSRLVNVYENGKFWR
jgi:hypothetical protein